MTDIVDEEGELNRSSATTSMATCVCEDDGEKKAQIVHHKSCHSYFFSVFFIFSGDFHRAVSRFGFFIEAPDRHDLFS